MKEHVFRLKENEDLKQSILAYCEIHHILAATIVCAVGCIKKIHLRKAKAIEEYIKEEDYEIVSCIGTIANNKAHIHISVSDESMHTIGGHLMDGTIVNTTAEIVLLELTDYQLDRVYDESTGYGELVVKDRK